ncbi:hypothetical protein [Thermincola ferriacetica]|uniref:hypothetical protein n=1 Tax=Thermincola ferriacetica TaxID=281456 RepID=UPI00128D57F8|nr:hypothetical protein [Thermincola ferriacetica]
MFYEHSSETGTSPGVHCRESVNGKPTPGPPVVDEADESAKKEINRSYWFRRQVDGQGKVDPVDRCKVILPAITEPSVKERELAKLIGSQTVDWLY